MSEPVAWMHHYVDGNDTTWEVDGISDPLAHRETRWTWTGCSPLYAHPAPSAEPAVEVVIKDGRVWLERGCQSWMLAYEDDDQNAIQWYAGTLRKALYTTPPDHREVMQMALNALVPLMNAHFPGERELLTDEQVIAASDAVAALEKALGEKG